MVLGHLQSLKKVKKPICFSTPVACSGLHLITSLKGTVSESFEGIEPKPASSSGGGSTPDAPSALRFVQTDCIVSMACTRLVVMKQVVWSFWKSRSVMSAYCRSHSLSHACICPGDRLSLRNKEISYSVRHAITRRARIAQPPRTTTITAFSLDCKSMILSGSADHCVCESENR